MAGINLSQSIKEKQALAQGSFFDRGFLINVVIFLAVLGLYGGLHWYLGTLGEELSVLQAESKQKTAELKGANADVVTDFHARMTAIGTNLPLNPDPLDVLGELEQMTLPTIRLTEYARHQAKSELGVQGVTTNLKYLAQQMLAYKRAVGVTSVHVESVKYNDTGEIEFELLLPLTSAPSSAAF
jgi:hypothetical protein